MSIWVVTISTLGRRKQWTILLIGLALLETVATMVLSTLIERQEAALEDTVSNTVISCVVTNTQGTNQDNLQMATGFVDILLGTKHDKGYHQDEYITNVRSKASLKLIEPQEYTIICLLSIDSDNSLTTVEGGSVTLYDGWDDSIFNSYQEVCVVPENYVSEKDYLEVTTGNYSKKLKIIGTHTGPENCFYCPFHTMEFHNGTSYMILVDSCSFDIKDARHLNDAKESLYELFVKPDINNPLGAITFGVRIEDDAFQRTINEINLNLHTLHMIIPALLFIGTTVGFVAANLSTQHRLREYALMRCLGMARSRVLQVTIGEHLLLALSGWLIGLILCISISGTLTFRMLLYGLSGIGAFLLGTALAVFRIMRINTMSLMKTEE